MDFAVRHPRGTTLRKALRGNLPLRGFLGASAVSTTGLCGVQRGSISEGMGPYACDPAEDVGQALP